MTTTTLTHPHYKLHRRANKTLNALVPYRGVSVLLERVFYVLATGIPVLFAILQFCEPDGQEMREPWKSLVDLIYQNRLLISILFAISQIILGAAIGILHWLRPIDFEKVSAILEMAVDTHFVDRDHQGHHYRATVFKIRGVSFLGGEWIGIICRSGETFLHSGTVFYLDRENPEKSTGLLGLCFAAQGATIVKADPLPVSCKEDYLRECRLAEIEYEKMNLRSSVILATGIRRRSGRLWGFLVLDTTDDGQCPKSRGVRGKDQHESDIGRSATVLGMLIR